MRYNEIRQSLTESRVGREYQHLEDLVFIEGYAGALKALHILEKLKESTHNLSIKFDGNPTVYWGREHDGSFVMTGKNGWGKSKSKSADELEEFILTSGKGEPWRPAFAESMAVIFDILEANTPKDFEGYFYGDVLWHPNNTVVINESSVEFTPNKVTYIVDEHNLKEQIKNSNLGIAVHKYFDSFGSTHGVEVKSPWLSEEVVLLGTLSVEASVSLDENCLTEMHNTIHQVGQQIDDFLSKRKGLSDIKNIIYTYVNQTSKAKNLNNLQTGFFEWLEQSTVSANKRQKITELHENNPKSLTSILNLVNTIMELKDSVIEQIDNSNITIKSKTGTTIGGEGYIDSISNIKFVPRKRWQPN